MLPEGIVQPVPQGPRRVGNVSNVMPVLYVIKSDTLLFHTFGCLWLLLTKGREPKPLKVSQHWCPEKLNRVIKKHLLVWPPSLIS